MRKGRVSGFAAALGRRALPLVLAALVAAAPPALAQTKFQPVVVVNDSAVTGWDLEQRMKLMVVLKVAKADAPNLKAVVLEQLVHDRLKLQAGKSIGVKPTDEMIKGALGELAKRAKLKPAEFLALMSAQGISKMALEDLAGAEAVWRQVIRTRFRNRVTPGAADIEAEIVLLKKHGATEIRLYEIGLPLTDGRRTPAKTRELAARLSKSLNAGGDFGKAVKRYSKAPSAARGGDLGWVPIARIPPQLAQALSRLKPGQVSGPLTVRRGISLLKVAGVRKGKAEFADDPRMRERVRRRLLIRRSARLAEGYLQELRRDALIERR